MKVKVKKRFIENLESFGDKELIDDTEFTLRSVEDAVKPENIPAFKWLSGHSNYGRIRIDNYRIGVRIDGDTVTFICLLHRSVIYKHFP